MSKYATKQRKALLDYLVKHADEAVSAKQITEALAEEGVSISAVYRNLSELEAEEKVLRISKGGSRMVYYRYTDTDECKEHLHMSCSECGRTYHMDVSVTNTLIRNVAQDAQFTIDRSSTTLYGICKDCQKRKKEQ